MYDDIPYNRIRNIHFGINDLSLALKEYHMFSMYLNPFFRSSVANFAKNNIPIGIGGIGHPAALPISPELIMNAAFSLSASRFILSRTFLSSLNYTNSDSILFSFVDQISQLDKIALKVNSFNSTERIHMLSELGRVINYISEL